VVVAAKFPALGAANTRYLKLGLIGHPVSHSISPLLHGAALSFAGIAGEYNLIDVDAADLSARIASLAEEGYSGFNVTVPHKQAVLRAVDSLSDEARRVGAVNTVGIADGGKLIGHNTDLGGFIRALHNLLPESFSCSSRQAVLIGAGGAARAGMYGLMECGFQNVVIVARDESKALELKSGVTQMEISVLDPKAAASLRPALVVNCTPIGQKDDFIPEWLEALFSGPTTGSAERYFYDMVYAGKARCATPLVELASAQGWQSMDGLAMLISQAALAFTFWTGIEVPPEVMETALH
jgi:shikimate dehydrogenase